MKIICWAFILFFILVLSSIYKERVENFDQIHGKTFWNYWDTPVINKYKYFPNWANPYWGPSYWPGGPNVKNYI
ncbi:unnamed protein product [marine sediment metagenome]|uniref:Uncharacterized protein n=1 Tax=marine sediment metagenome TaxID=412755 RepID=X1VV62_9ZZZZ